MTSIKLTITGAQAWASVTGPLTSGMVGIPVTIEYDEAWDGLTKNLMCRCSPWGSDNGENRAILNVGENATVAHEVMQSGMYLYLGVEGFSDDGKLVIPTTWARCGKIEYGASTCEDPSADPELPVWNQLQTEMEQLKEYTLSQDQVDDVQAYAQEAAQAAQEARQAADEAKQAASVGGSSLYYTPVVTQPTSDTLRFEFKPSATGAPIPKPVTVKLPVSEGPGHNVEWMYVTVEVEDEIPCTGITLDKTVLTFDGVGQKTIVATVTPADTTDMLKWTSSKPAVATVANGVVTAYANGSATITATCGEYSATCAVEVSGISEEDTVAVTGVKLDKATASVQAGSTITLTATVEPDNATNKTVIWTSDNEPVATVVGGVVTGISEGTASIGAMTADGGFSAVCNVTVAAASNYRNLFDKDTMVTANQGIAGVGIIGAYNWGLARVPVKENTVYSIKTCDTFFGSYYADQEAPFYNCATAGAFGFADKTGDTLISCLAFANTQALVEAGTHGANALLRDYCHGDVEEGATTGMEWITFTTPAGCAYLLFNTTLKNNADKIQLEEGDTIHDYYLPYDGGAE